MNKDLKIEVLTNDNLRIASSGKTETEEWLTWHLKQAAVEDRIVIVRYGKNFVQILKVQQRIWDDPQSKAIVMSNAFWRHYGNPKDGKIAT